MIRVAKVNFQASKAVIQKLFELNRLSANVYNDCLDIAKEYHKTTGKWIGKTDLQKATKGQYPMHSQSIQAVCHKYVWARDSIHKAKKQGIKTARYPYRQKKHFNTKWAKDGFVVHSNNKITLSLGIWNRKRQQPLCVKVAHLPQGTIKEIELIYDCKLMLAITYDDGKDSESHEGKQVAAIDQGEIHAIASVCENGNSLVITGRKLRSIHRLRNKKLAELQRMLSKCQKGSRQWKRYNRAKQYVLSKSEAQLKDGLHKITKNFVDWCIENHVKEVVIGQLDGVQRYTGKKAKSKKKRRTRLHNQKVSQWSFGKMQNYLQYKLSAHSVVLTEGDESFTTQTCPVCGKRKKNSSRVYTCNCGYSRHRDVHGGSNFLSKHLYGDFRYIEVDEIKYLRIA
ncbi:transposase (plasmid) [Brevibacillus halotolerans]|nr:transposase [Brevibacillus halotolerans]